MSRTRIESYEVVYSANAFMPRIWLKGRDGYIGQLIFHPNGDALPADDADTGSPSLHYHLDDFHNALDLLRHEQALWLLYAGSGEGYENTLKTGAEAVGESEADFRHFPLR